MARHERNEMKDWFTHEPAVQINRTDNNSELLTHFQAITVTQYKYTFSKCYQYLCCQV